MTLSLRQRWQNEQKTDFNFVVITRLSTAANKKVPAMDRTVCTIHRWNF